MVQLYKFIMQYFFISVKWELLQDCLNIEWISAVFYSNESSLDGFFPSYVFTIIKFVIVLPSTVFVCHTVAWTVLECHEWEDEKWYSANYLSLVKETNDKLPLSCGIEVCEIAIL